MFTSTSALTTWNRPSAQRSVTAPIVSPPPSAPRSGRTTGPGRADTVSSSSPGDTPAGDDGACARHHQEAAILANAHDVIARTCGWRLDQAADVLLDAAWHHHLDTVSLARGLLELLTALPVNHHDLRGPAAVAFTQWGAQLQRSHCLTGEATPAPDRPRPARMRA